jgi:DNA polymerase elongation subunit (family B)
MWLPEVNDPDDDLLKPIVSRSVSILTLDIETSPHLAYSFDVWQANISPEKIMEASRVLMVGAKWYDRNKVIMLTEQALGHREMIRQSWRLVDQADVIVHYNGRKFDMRHLRREWLLAGMPPPRPFKQVDLLQVVRKQFANPSNKLDAISQVLGIGQKIQHQGFALWKGCLDGDPKAWAKMARYCRGDVLLTERLYDRLRPWITHHPHVTASDQLRCNRCGSANLTPIGDYTAVVLAYGQWRCDDCGGTVRTSNSKRVAKTRGTA